MPPEPIAIIGVSAELPSGDDVNLDFSSFWPFLLRKGEAYSPIPQDIFNYDTFSYLITPQSGAFLSRPTLFDPFEFGIPASEALMLPVSTRKLLEHSFLALRDSGINYRGANVGVYTSGVVHDPSMFSDIDPHTPTGLLASLPSGIANRISYHLDLRGPSFPLDTACSSTVTVTHLAVQALRNGDCESAVVGGAQLNLRLSEWIQYSQLGVISEDGKCKPFDASADGFSRGEGVVCIVLKPLDAALRDGDRVYATILGSAINATGNQAPLGAPVAAAQQAAMFRAYEQAGKNPDEVDFVEMHATGTAAGDPTEANWVGEAFRHKDGSPLLAGSVKGNIGHLEITSFLVSLLKVLHIVEHNTIPPTANFTTPNPKINWEEYNLQVPNITPVSFTPRAPSQKALISLSSFGIGGANGHVIVEGQGPGSNTNGKSDTQQRHLFENDDAILIMSGGLSPRSASVMADLLKEAFSHTPKESLPFLARLASRQSRQLTWRSYALYHPYVEIPKPITFCDAQLVPRTAPRLAFIFNGQGPQHRLMGHQLFAKYPVFRHSVYECDKAYQVVTSGSSLLKDYGFFSGPATSDSSIHWTVLLPALTVFQIALFDLLCSFGIKPDIVVGHSAGETAVLYTSGAGPKEMAVQLSVARSQMMRPAETPEGGNMAALSCGEVKVRELINEILAKEGVFDVSLQGRSLVIACYNGPEGIVVTGLVDLIGKLCALAEKHGIIARRLRIYLPAHSPLMDICEESCATLVGNVFGRFPKASKPTIATYSTVTAEKWEESYSTDYYWRNTRQPVLFNQVISKLAKQYPNMCYIEISPHPSLSSYVSSAAPSSDVICPSRRPTKAGEFLEHTTFLESLGQLAMKGFNVNFDVLNGLPAWEPNVKLPPYPFNKRDIPFHLDSPAFNKLLEPRKGPLNDPRLRLSTKTHPLLAGHVIHSKPILPASGFIEMALEFGARTLSNVEFLAALPLPSDVPATVEVVVDGAEWTVKTSSSVDFPTFDRLHARGILTYEADETDSAPLDLACIKSRCAQSCRIEDLYEHAFRGYAEYSTEFRRMNSCVQGEDELFAIFQGSVGLPECHKYVFDPVVLDAIFHGCMFFIMQSEPVFLDYESRDYFLPSRVSRVVLHEALMISPLPDQIAARFVLKDWTPERVSFNICIANLAGERLCTLSLFEMTRHSNHIDRPVKRHYQTEWLPIALPAAGCKDQYYIRELSNNTNDLRRILDTLAAQTIVKTMKEQVAVDTECHQHYWGFAKEVIERIELYPPPDPSLVDSLMGQYPSYFKVTEHASKVHADIFNSSITTVKSLHSNTENMRNFYGPDNMMQPSCREAARLFRDLLEQFSMAGKKVIRVLELGCGTTTGILTEHLVNVLPDFPGLVVEYFVSDTSLDPALQLAEKLQHPYMRAIAYDLTKSIGEQEIVPTSFDVVTACCVLHGTSNLKQTMSSISELLVPGGYTLAVELDGASWEHRAPGTLWYDFIFGDFEDRDDRVSHCAVPLRHWRKLLQSAEFDCITFSSSHPDEDHTFVFIAQKANGIRCILPDSDAFDDQRFFEEFCESDLVFTYQYGHEMDLRDRLEKLNKSERLSIWIMATAGLDGAGAHGLVQTLIREFILWTIRLVTFDISWSIPKRMAAISSLQKKSLRETEIKIGTGGEIYISRIVPFVASPSTVPFESSLPWAQIDGEIVHTTPSLREENDIDIHILHWSSTDKDHPKAFLGTVVGDGLLKFPKGSCVMGITVGPLTNFLVTHAGSVVPSEIGHSCILADIPGIVTAALALNPDALIRFGRLKTIGRVLVTDVHTTIGFAAARFCLALGLDTFCISEEDATKLSEMLHVPVDRVSAASNAVWIAQQRGGYDVIISGAQTKAASQTIKQLASPGGTVHMWNSPSQNLLSCLKHDPWSAIQALEAALRILPKDFASYSPSIPVGDIVSHVPASVLQQIRLFDATKIYILIGGVGKIGVQMALWMYENGARDVILTSRRGRETLRRTGQIDSLRILRYLERLPDLRLQLEAVDAVSYEATKQLLGSLEKPLGGCFLMSTVLSDKMFLNQTRDNFDKVAAAQTKTFLNLERCINISKLDFFVTFSSIAALFGNAGQSAYSTESAAVESMISKYSNAFSLFVPGIIDSSRLAHDQRNEGFHTDQLFEWVLTTQELFDCLGDGLRTLRHVPFQQYIPELNWNLIRRDLGSLTTFEHLCVNEKVQIIQPTDVGRDNKANLESLVRRALDIPIEVFSSNIPFTSYGLDSLIAARLSVAIRVATGVKVTQIQLLADMTLEELFRETSSTVLKNDE